MRGNNFKLITIILFTTLILTEINFVSSANAENSLFKDNFKQIIIVSKNGGDYTSVQKAIDNVPEGTTIYVKAGKYNETINIKKRINLEGENKNNTLINPISEKNKYAIRLGAPGIIVKNLSITNGAPGLYTTGIRVSVPEIVIHNCNIYNTPVGIVLWASNNIINNCTFWGCEEEGIALIGSTNSKCDNNKIINCIFRNNCDGIELQYSSNNTITDCIFYENTHTGIDAIASSNNNNTIFNCKIYKNMVHGIYFSASADNKIIDCSISENRDGNIIMNKNSHNNLIRSEVDQNPDDSKIVQILSEIRKSYYKNDKVISEKSVIVHLLEAISNLLSSLKNFK